MIKIENKDIYGFEPAIRGMRNPMNSWDKGDSYHDYDSVSFELCGDSFVIGEKDLALMRKLAHAGDDHGKFARFINVTVDVTAPLYFFKEMDTYKVGTVANSCSTMHKIHDKEFELDDFSHEHLLKGMDVARELADVEGEGTNIMITPLSLLEITIGILNENRKLYLATKDKKYWWQMIQLLPSSYNQKRTMQFNYQVLNRIYHARKNHKLDEWREFCKWIEKLPHFKEIYLGGE